MQIDELKKVCQGDKLKVNTGLTLWNRKVSIHFTRLCVFLKISANQATWGSILFGLIASGLFLSGYSWLNLLGAVLLYLSLVLDQVDGELARYYGTVNFNGVYLDEIRHLLIYPVPFFCLAYPLQYVFNAGWPVLVGFIGALVLIIDRIEQRLPLLIFTDRVLLKNNMSLGNTLRVDVVDSITEFEGQASKSIAKILAIAVYRVYGSMSDQVIIIIYIVAATILDIFTNSITINGLTFNRHFQLLFILLLSISGMIVVPRTIIDHWKDGWTESIMNNISNKWGNDK